MLSNSNYLCDYCHIPIVLEAGGQWLIGPNGSWHTSCRESHFSALESDNTALREALSVFVKYGDMVSSMGNHHCLFCGMYGHPVIEHFDGHANGGFICPVPAARKLVEAEG